MVFHCISINQANEKAAAFLNGTAAAFLAWTIKFINY